MHMRIHTETKSFSCGICDASFTQKGHLKYHLQTHNKKRKRPQVGSQRKRCKQVEVIDEEKEEFGEEQRDAWLTSMRAHAISNGLWLGAANRVGVEGRLEFWGSSFVASPRGEVVAKADASEEGLISADCVLDEIDVVRTHWPFLRDRRIDAYEGLTRRWID